LDFSLIFLYSCPEKIIYFGSSWMLSSMELDILDSWNLEIKPSAMKLLLPIFLAALLFSIG
jgi:hypothetical protein